MKIKTLNKDQWMNKSWFESEENYNSILKAGESFMLECIKLLMIDVCTYYDLKINECYSMMASNKFDYITHLCIDHVGNMVDWNDGDDNE